MLQTPCQLELFPGFIAPATRAPKLTLPWTEQEEIDSARVAKILGVSEVHVQRFLKVGCLRYYRLPGLRSNARILYESLVEYCDGLRVQYMIPARHKRVPGRRLRDDQLLPFPLSETVSLEEVAATLRCGLQSVPQLIDAGEIVAYRLLFGSAAGHWRVHRPSVERYVAKLHAMAERRTSPRPEPNRS